MDYKIKQVPEDFIVRELMELPTGSGRYAYYRLTKREQFISILHGPKKSLELQNGEVSLEYLGHGRERLNLGTLEGNEFEITVRNLPKEFTPNVVKQFPNYFDTQRFGQSLNNQGIGKFLIQREFQKACELIPETKPWLDKSPRDYVGALRSLQKRILRIYAHAYQSWLWNLTCQEYLKDYSYRVIEWPLGELIIPEKSVKSLDIPILGYDSKIPKNLEKVINSLLEKEEIKLEQFRLPQFPEFDLKGNERSLMVEPMNLLIGDLETDDLNQGKFKRLVKFSLPKGSYATMVIRVIFS
jgi:tRNA pseudouridine13 synthase